MTTRLSQDHRTDDPLEIARIEKGGGFLYRGRVLGVLALTRSLGDHLLKRFVIAHPHVRQDDLMLDRRGTSSFLIIACDGLFDVLSDEEASSLVLACTGSTERKSHAATTMVEAALERGTTDNVSALVVWL